VTDLISLSVPAHISPDHLSGLDRLIAGPQRHRTSRIAEVYGSLPASVLGHARPASRVPAATVEDLRTYVAGLHRLGLRFHYTLNAPWSEALERSLSGRERIRAELDGLVDAGVDGFVIANPYLLQLVRRWYPKVCLVGSINLRVCSVQGARRVLELGADRVVMEREVNRDLRLLRSLHEELGERVLLLANSTCLMECPYQHYHALECGLLSRPAAVSVPDGGRSLELDDPEACFDYCLDRFLRDPAELLRSSWIRPEDLGRYAEIGVRRIKIQGRGLPPENQLRLTSAYLDGQTPAGDLLELFPGFRDALTTRSAVTGLGAAPPSVLQKLDMAELEATGFFSFFFDRKLGCAGGCSSCQHCLATLRSVEARRTGIGSPR